VPPVNAAAKGATQPRAVAPWVEPDAAEPAKAIAPKFDADLLASLDLTSAAAPSNEAAPSPVTTVRRGAAADGKQQLSSLRNALDLLSGSVEVADDGPFYEQDLRINGSTRMVRAAEGGRVMIAYEKPTLQSARARPAVFVIDGKNVTLEGVDLVVRAADLTPQQTAIFLCRRGSLALRNCTVTIEGPIERPLAVVQLGSIDPAGSGGRATVRLERTLVRAPGASLIQIADGDALAEVVECIGVSGAAPAFRFAGAAAETRIGRLGRGCHRATQPDTRARLNARAP
jgi:serine/threonine-protein kinase